MRVAVLRTQQIMMLLMNDDGSRMLVVAVVDDDIDHSHSHHYCSDLYCHYDLADAEAAGVVGRMTMTMMMFLLFCSRFHYWYCSGRWN